MKNSQSTRIPGMAASSTPSKQFDPWIVWVTFRRCWPWALPVGAILATFTALYIIQSFVPMYRAQYHLVANRDYILTKGVMPVVSNLARSEKPLFLNSIVLSSALEDPVVQSAPSLSNPLTAEANLRKGLTFAGAGSASQLIVSYTEADPQSAAAICNAVVDAYLNQRDAFDNERVSRVINWLEPVILHWQQEVTERQRRVETLTELTMGVMPGNQNSMIESEAHFAIATALRTDITNLNVNIAVAEAKLLAKAGDSNSEKLTKPEADEPPSVVRRSMSDVELKMTLDNMVKRNSEVVEARRRLRFYEQKLIRFDDQPRQIGIHREDYNRTKQSILDWRAAITKAKEDARPIAIKELDEIIEAEYQNRIIASKSNKHIKYSQEQMALADLRILLEAKEELFKKESERLAKFEGMTTELHFAREEKAVAFDIHRQLRARVISIQTELNQDGAVRTMARATPPKTPVAKMPYKKLVMGCIVALFCPFLIGLLWEFRTQRLTDSNMCDKNGLSVIGEIARLPSGSRTSKGSRVFEESIDTLRAGLFLSVDTRNTRTIAVVSSMSGEGKSSVSSQLALSIAKATGETVLLVDADLRCPDQHEIFGLDIGPGLSGVMSGTATLSEATNTSLGDLIHVLPAGPLSSSPHRLISPDKMAEFIDNALKQYRYIVVDTAPVLSAGESLAVASAVDATLLCVMRDVSRMDNVMRTTRRLEAVGATLAGTVFSGVSARQYAYRYGDYHYASPQPAVTQVS